VKREWWSVGTNSFRDRFEYTYDYAGNRLSRDIPSAVYSTDDRDQKYTYDGLHRLTNYQQGTLSSGAITSAIERRTGRSISWGTGASLGNVTRAAVGAMKSRARTRFRHFEVIEEQAVDAEPHDQPLLIGLYMNVRSTAFDALAQHHVHELNDRRSPGRVQQVFAII
jgi:hypothetical protein